MFYEQSEVKKSLNYHMKLLEIKLTENEIDEMLFFIRPIWSRRNESKRAKDRWADTYETPEFMQLVSAANKVYQWELKEKGQITNKIVDGFLNEADPKEISKNKQGYARKLVVRQKLKAGRPQKV